MIIKELVRARYPVPPSTNARALSPDFQDSELTDDSERVSDKEMTRIRIAPAACFDTQPKEKATFRKIKTLEAMKKFKADAIQLRSDISRARAERKSGL